MSSYSTPKRSINSDYARRLRAKLEPTTSFTFTPIKINKMRVQNKSEPPNWKLTIASPTYNQKGKLSDFENQIDELQRIRFAESRSPYKFFHLANPPHKNNTFYNRTILKSSRNASPQGRGYKFILSSTRRVNENDSSVTLDASVNSSITSQQLLPLINPSYASELKDRSNLIIARTINSKMDSRMSPAREILIEDYKPKFIGRSITPNVESKKKSKLII